MATEESKSNVAASADPRKAPRVRSVSWNADAFAVQLIDQRKLPTSFELVNATTTGDVAKCIKTMVVRGAPAIGATAAFGMVIAAKTAVSGDGVTADGVIAALTEAKALLDEARPTAVNLSWATSRLLKFAKATVAARGDDDGWAAGLPAVMLEEAQRLAEQDVAINKRIGEFGATVVKQGANILHHCNTGALATVDIGTAIGVIYECHNQGKGIHVWVDETRPRLQGSRLSAWELTRAGVPMHLIADNAAGMLMRRGKVDVVLFGADRVAANGDVANKIGTYKLAVVGRENGVQVYACVPTSTIDLSIATGDEIEIEERSPTEVTTVFGTVIAPPGVAVYNPAFDVTPHKYLTGIITEEGICYPPYTISLPAAVAKAKARYEAEQA